ncbi:MAG: hypothetical protein IPI45_07450 [Saprospiraceae bacterium]|nr:hypothetical protein [Saprospiraceae bacterium]MBK7737597.1 hypothetical protein [Saprospiraceae bacterium]MBK7913818.1 hypothetical protein [Saprospiraceae bacterium]
MKPIILTILASLILSVSNLSSQLNPNISKIDPIKSKSIPALDKNVNLDASWYNLEGSMSQIDAQNGEVWALGTKMVGRQGAERMNYEVFYLKGNQTWQFMNGHGVKLTVTSRGEPWLINANREIYKGVFTPEKNGIKASVVWHRMPGLATDIDACYDGIFILTTNKIPGTNDYSIAFWNEREWVTQSGMGGVKIAVDPQYQPWVINSKNEVYQRKSNGEWKQHSQKADCIDIDIFGNVYIGNMTEGKKQFGYPVSVLNFKKANPFWQNIGGEVISIATDDHRILVLNNYNQVFTRYYKSNEPTSSNEILLDKEVFYNLCPKGSGSLDFTIAPKLLLRTKWILSKDSSRVFLSIYAQFYQQQGPGFLNASRPTARSSGEWIMPVGKPAAFGTKYTGAEFLNYDAISSELIVQLKNTGFNEINNGCDGREEILDLTNEAIYRDSKGRTKSVIDEIRVIGDTGGNDVSTDDDCNCDARILSLRIKPFKLKTQTR